MPELVLPPDDGKMTPPPERKKESTWESEKEVLMLSLFVLLQVAMC